MSSPVKRHAYSKTEVEDSGSGKRARSDCFIDGSPEPFTSDDGLTDIVILVVEGKRLYVSRNFLAMASPVFKRMFSSDFLEKTASCITLKDKVYSDMMEFLQCLHPNIQKRVTDANVFTVLPLADEYQVTSVLRSCKATLIAMLHKYSEYVQNALIPSHIENLRKARYLDIMEKAEFYQMPEVVEKGIQVIGSINSMFYRDHETFLKLPMSTRNRIFYKRLCIKD